MIIHPLQDFSNVIFHTVVQRGEKISNRASYGPSFSCAALEHCQWHTMCLQ